MRNQLYQHGLTQAGLMYSWKGKNVGTQLQVLRHILATDPALIDLMYNQVR